MPAAVRRFPDGEREAVLHLLVGGEGHGSARRQRLPGVPQAGVEEWIDDTEGVLVGLHRQPVDEAPRPLLTVLEGLHDRMATVLIVLRGVPVRARVAAVRRPADEALT